MKQFGGGAYGGSDSVVTDGMELQQKLEKLYISTRAGKVAWSSCSDIFSFTNQISVSVYFLG